MWKKHPGRGELLFAELMIWSWVRRWISELRVARASKTLAEDLVSDSDDARRGALLQRLALDLQARDPYTQSHVRRVARYASLIARQMGLDDSLVAKIRLAAVVHDVGKINVPRAILNKPGALSAEEFAVMSSHVESGVQLVSGACDEDVVAMVRHHHERLDGSGYPDGLTGDAIPVGARVIAVADTFDAIISTRPYRLARSHKQAMDVLVAEAGGKLDAAAVEAFRRGYEGRRALGIWVVLADLPRGLLSGLGADATAAGIVPLQTALAGVALAAALAAPFVGTHDAFKSQPRGASSALSARVQATRGGLRPSVRSPVVGARRASVAASSRPRVLPLRTARGASVAARSGGRVVPAPTRGPSVGSNGGSGSGGSSGSGGGGSRGGGVGQGGGGSPGAGGAPGGPAPVQPSAPAQSSAPVQPSAPNPTLIDRVVAVVTTVTNHVPAPVGPLGTNLLNAAAGAADRILPPPLGAGHS
jgi:putative nucleotidyltransferase with HDIG domain